MDDTSSLPPKPADCTCSYPMLIARNMCGHAPDCPVYVQWRRELEARKEQGK